MVERLVHTQEVSGSNPDGAIDDQEVDMANEQAVSGAHHTVREVSLDPCERVAEELGQRSLAPEEAALVREVREEYVKLARFLLAKVRHCPTLTVALRGLVSSKDDAVRAVIFP